MVYGFLTIFLLCAVVCLVVRQAFAEVRADFQDQLHARLGSDLPRKWVVGGMMGSGKSTFARLLAGRMGLPHIEIDRLPTGDEILSAAEQSDVGWIAEANPWQIPVALARMAEVVIFLDYRNSVNYVRLLLRGYQEWKALHFSLIGFKQTILNRTISDLGRIVYRYGKANREGWRKNGLFGEEPPTSQIYIRCISPAELAILKVILWNRLENQKRVTS